MTEQGKQHERSELGFEGLIKCVSLGVNWGGLLLILKSLSALTCYDSEQCELKLASHLQRIVSRKAWLEQRVIWRNDDSPRRIRWWMSGWDLGVHTPLRGLREHVTPKCCTMPSSCKYTNTGIKTISPNTLPWDVIEIILVKIFLLGLKSWGPLFVLLDRAVLARAMPFYKASPS